MSVLTASALLADSSYYLVVHLKVYYGCSYWQSEAEKRGDSPFKDPLAIIGIIAILFPFIFVLIAIAFGVIDVNGGR